MVKKTHSCYLRIPMKCLFYDNTFRRHMCEDPQYPGPIYFGETVPYGFYENLTSADTAQRFAMPAVGLELGPW